jgi:23S rRNA pseudoU1915 N3-methylase RlmH
LIQAQLAVQEQALAELTERARQQREDADRNEERARLHAQAADAVRELMIEASRHETAALRRDLQDMERRARRDQMTFLIVGSLLGAILGVVSTHLFR